MNADSFFQHYQVQTNPFAAEEARLDPVFERLLASNPTHPDFDKILGRIDQPATAIVFGEKGSGKTAIRLLLAQEIRRHNAQQPGTDSGKGGPSGGDAREGGGRILPVVYDDLNPVLDRLLQAHKQNARKMLENFRLEDHQDAILSRAVTKLVDGILGEASDEEQDDVRLPEEPGRALRRMPRQRRVDLAVLAAVYDQPRSGTVTDRFASLRGRLKLGWRLPTAAVRYASIFVTVLAIVLGIAAGVMHGSSNEPWWLEPATGLAIAAAILGWLYWVVTVTRIWWLSRGIVREVPAVERGVGELRAMLASLGPGALARQPFPLPAKDDQQETDKHHAPRDSRYQLTRRFVDAIQPLGYRGMMVLIDRIDEPTAISGDAQRMKAVVWPMFDNKFLKQDRIGLKLLLPIELRHLLRGETAQFFQEARLDKQNMIDRLEWSGTTLYDLVSARLRACRPEDAEPIQLTDLFQEDVDQAMVIDALDQMHQPRDAFKFLYAVIQEHCRLVPEDHADYKIARLTLETVRRSQSQRVQELHRGLTPA